MLVRQWSWSEVTTYRAKRKKVDWQKVTIFTLFDVKTMEFGHHLWTTPYQWNMYLSMIR